MRPAASRRAGVRDGAGSSQQRRRTLATANNKRRVDPVGGMPVTEDTVLSFVQSSIRSAWALELLLLLRRDPGRAWGVEELVRELRGSFALVTESLQSLAAAGLVAADDDATYVYRPRSPELDELVAGLVALNAQKPTTVLRTIFTSPSDKIRSFSDAFLLRRGDRK
ncbi:MAG: hypothetical protein ACM3JG_08815 [Thiohalocapsa sp.]